MFKVIVLVLEYICIVLTPSLVAVHEVGFSLPIIILSSVSEHDVDTILELFGFYLIFLIFEHNSAHNHHTFSHITF